MMLSRIASRAANFSGRLSKQVLTAGQVQKLAVAAQSTTSVSSARPELVIKSRYTPSGNVPTSPEYENVPVEVDGEKVVASDAREIYQVAPYVPELSDEPEKVEAAGEEAAVAKEQSLEDEICVWFGHDMPTIYDDQKPERDVVNFPRVPFRLEEQPETRMIFLPESYFKFFHEKTGVTGPYLFMGTFGAFLISKEYLVLAEDAYNGFVLVTMIAFGAKKWGKQLNQYVTGIERKKDQSWIDWQAGMIAFLGDYIQKNRDVQKLSVDQGILFQAKRENVHLQREAEYRRRLMAAYNEAKRKLDYHVAIEAAQKQFAQSHLVNWVIDNVHKSITPELQNLVLQQSLNDLKSLSLKRKNAI